MASFHAVRSHTASSSKSRRRQPHVTAYFADGARSFLLAQGATLGDLAGYIDDLGPHHDGEPFAIQIKFAMPTTPTIAAPTFPSNTSN